MLSCRLDGEPFALATLAAADGGPRPRGSQMLVSPAAWWGFLSGGCIEADVALHGRAVLETGEPRLLVYGRGSPFVDMRLPCGGRLDVLIERVEPHEASLSALAELTDQRRPARWLTDGSTRRCGEPESVSAWPGCAIDLVYAPRQRLVAIGSDPFAIGIAQAGHRLGWETTLLDPFGSEAPPHLDAAYSRLGIASFFAQHPPDPWTAVAVATHEADRDQEALLEAFRSDAGYIGLLGSRRRLPERLAALEAAGVDTADLSRLRAPIGLDLGATSPREVAVSVVAEIIRLMRGGDQVEPNRHAHDTRLSAGKSIASADGRLVPA